MIANCIAPNSNAVHRNMTHEICDECAGQPAALSDNRVLLDLIDAPVLLMQGNPRPVVTANKQAPELFGKELHEIERHRGGEVFDCIHAFTEIGCGKDVNCENCKIKNAIVDMLTTSTSHNGVSTELSIQKANGTRPYVLQVSTEKIADLALVKVERYEADA